MDCPNEPTKIQQIKLHNKIKNLKPPSKETRVYWIYEVNSTKVYPKPTINSGKWLIFSPFNDIDRIWNLVSNMTSKGLLGDVSKVSTKVMKDLKKSTTHVICVYTYDCTDINDVDRIKSELGKIVNINGLRYKTDKQTLGIKN